MAEELVRNYKMSDAELALTATQIAAFATLDLAELAEYNVTAGDITALVALENQFEEYPPDSGFKAQVSAKAALKDAKRTAAETIVGKIETRAKLVFGEGSPSYKEFSFVAIGRAKDAEFHTRSRAVANKAEDYLTALAAKAQTQDEIDDLRALNDEYELALSDIKVAERVREVATEGRITLGNALYAALVPVADAGKAVFENVSQAKYKRYVIYDDENVPDTPPDAPTGLSVEVATLIATWLATAGASAYKVYIQSPAGAGDYTIAHEGVIYTLQFALPPQPGAFNVKVLARNAAGDGPLSEAVNVSYGLAAPGGFAYNTAAGRFEWVVVAGVTRYHMQASYDGGETWNDIFDNDETNGYYAWSPPPGMFRIRARDGAATSAWVTTTVA